MSLGASFHVGWTDESLMVKEMALPRSLVSADGDVMNFSLGPPGTTRATATLAWYNASAGKLARNTCPNGKPSSERTAALTGRAGVFTYGSDFDSPTAPTFASIWGTAPYSGKTIIFAMRVVSLTEAGSSGNNYGNPVLWEGGAFNRLELNAYDVGGSAWVPTLYHYDGTDDIARGAPLPYNQWKIFTCRHLGGNIQLRINGGPWVTVASGNSNSFDSNGDLRDTSFSGSGKYALGYRAHLAVWPTGISDEDCELAEQWIASDIGLTLSPTELIPPAVAGNTGWWDFTNAASLYKSGIRGTPVTTDEDVITYIEAYDNGSTNYRAIRKNDAIGVADYKVAIVNGKSVGRIDDTTNSLRGTFEKYRKTDLVSQGQITSTELFSTTGKTVIMAISISFASAQNGGGTYANNPILGDDGNRFQIGCQNLDASNVTVRPYNYDGTEDAVGLNVPKNTWMILSVKHDGTTLKIRRDGNPTWTSIASGPTDTYTGNVYLGQAGVPGRTDFDIAYFATYNVAVPDADIRLVEEYFASQLAITLV